MYQDIILKSVVPAVSWACTESAAEPSRAYDAHPLKKQLDRRRLAAKDDPDCEKSPFKQRADHMPQHLQGEARQNWILKRMKMDQPEYIALSQHITSTVLQPLLRAKEAAVETTLCILEDMVTAVHSLPTSQLRILASVPALQSFCGSWADLDQLLFQGSDVPRWADHAFAIHACPPLEPTLTPDTMHTWLMQLQDTDIGMHWARDGMPLFTPAPTHAGLGMHGSGGLEGRGCPSGLASLYR